MLKYSCAECGYGAPARYDYGFSGIAFAPMVCQDCHAVRSIPTRIADGPHLHFLEDGRVPQMNACPDCGADGEALSALPVPREARQPEDAPCPSCGAEKLRAHSIGLWD